MWSGWALSKKGLLEGLTILSKEKLKGSPVPMSVGSVVMGWRRMTAQEEELREKKETYSPHPFTNHRLPACSSHADEL